MIDTLVVRRFPTHFKIQRNGKKSSTGRLQESSSWSPSWSPSARLPNAGFLKRCTHIGAVVSELAVQACPKPRDWHGS